ncbi:MAG: hypothetical protein HS111_01060 [Kofleriaceae bacterium]|nr:hypothetical protein [Kofleriaceae bacterium]
MIVVQHMPPHFTAALAERLTLVAAHRARGRARRPPMPGLVALAPRDRHLELDERGLVALSDGAHRPRLPARRRWPSARCWPPPASAAVAPSPWSRPAWARTARRRGAGDQGRRRHATFAQDQATSVIYGMPRAAIVAAAPSTPWSPLAEARRAAPLCVSPPIEARRRSPSPPARSSPRPASWPARWSTIRAGSTSSPTTRPASPA